MKFRPILILIAGTVIAVAAAAVTIYALRNPDGGSYVQPDSPAEFDHAHPAFDRVLKAHVKESQVDYSAIKADPADLNTFLDDAAAVKKSTFDSWTKDQQLAFLIDLYNAATIQIILDHYPLKSIKDIGNAVVGAWQKPVVRLFGEKQTLNYLEHDLILKNYGDPRVHFALVCAAKSCPPLRPEAFVPDKLNAQLDDQGKVFLADDSKNYVSRESKTAHLSKIFDWYGDDFTDGNKPILEALSPWMPTPAQKLIQTEEIEVQYEEYDWSLNDAN